MQFPYNLFVFGLGVGLVALQRRRPDLHPLAGVLLYATIAEATAMGLMVGGLIEDGFAWFRLTAWLVFVHLPAALVLTGTLTRKERPRSALLHGALAAVLVAIAVDAFLIEPRWLQITRVVVESDAVDAPIRIVVLSDVQTDDVGAYEAHVFALAMAERPDLLLMPGDFVQVEDEAAYAVQRDRWNAMIREHVPKLPLGAFAVQGNVDYRRSWPDLFRDTHVTPIVDTTTADLDRMRLTGLSFVDGQVGVPILAGPDFHVAFAHYPDFSLADAHADLLIAGHTHGGQVQLPGIGPVLTMSKVPRAWADTTTRLPGDRTLIVSRGIGMERQNAPRLRFLCRPEIVVVDVVPAGRGAAPRASAHGEVEAPPIR